MDRRRIRRECTALVDDLTGGRPFGIDDFCRLVGERRGRPLRRIPMALPGGMPHGLWVATQGVDYVIFEARTGPLHQEHIVLHELGHMLWEHEITPKIGALRFRDVLPDLDPQMVQRVLRRTRYSDVEERQAEMMASLMLERIKMQSPPSRRAAPGPGGVISRLEQSLVPRD